MRKNTLINSQVESLTHGTRNESMIIFTKMDIPPLPSTPSPSTSSLLLGGGTKPVPFPRRTSPSLFSSSGRESPSNNIPSSPALSVKSISGDPSSISSNEAIYANDSQCNSPVGLMKPVPLPRKLVNRLTSSSSSTSSFSSASSTASEVSSPASSRNHAFLSNPTTLEEHSDEDSLDYESIPSKPNQSIVNEKTGTINIFKLANTIDDPFDTDFEKSIKDGEIHTTNESTELSFSSPLNELDDETRRRISTVSSYSSSTSTTNTSDDSSDLYMEPPPARPVSSDIATSAILASISSRRYSNFGTGNRNSSFPKPIKEEENESEDFSIGAGQVNNTNSPRSHNNKLPLTKVASCPPAPSGTSDDSTYEPISNASDSSSSTTSSISKVNFISSSSNQTSTSYQNSSQSQLPSNPYFNQAKRITVPNVGKLQNLNGTTSSSPQVPLNQTSAINTCNNLNKNSVELNISKKFDLNSSPLRSSSSSSSSSTRTSDSSTKNTEGVGGGGSSWSLTDKEDSSTSLKRRSLASLTESTDSFGSFDRVNRVHLRRTASNRSTTSVRGGKKIHEYDDVAIEDGNVILLNDENEIPNHSSANNLNQLLFPPTLGNSNCSPNSPPLRSNSNDSSKSSLTSRNSVIAEFDPLLTTPISPTLQTSINGHSPLPNNNKPCAAASSAPAADREDEDDRISSLHLNEEQQHRYEYIDTDVDEDSDQRLSTCSSVAARSSFSNFQYTKPNSSSSGEKSGGERGDSKINSNSASSNFHPTSWENPGYFPVTPPEIPKRETFTVMKFSPCSSVQGAAALPDEHYEPVATPGAECNGNFDSTSVPNPNLNNLSLPSPPSKPERRSPTCSRNVIPPNVSSSPTLSQEDNIDAASASGGGASNYSEDVNINLDQTPTAQSQSQANSSPHSFFRRFSNKLKLNSIREENHLHSVNPALLSSVILNNSWVNGPPKCKKCHEEHSSGNQCKFSPHLRLDVVFSSNLYKPSSSAVALGRRDFPKKRVVLKDAKLKFLNEKSEVASEIPMERVCAITARDDHKVNTSLPDLKYFEFFLVLNGKSASSMVLAGCNDADRDSWMRKYVETYTLAIPLSVISSYQRGGWTFMKEAVTSEWNLSVMVLKERQLYISYQGTGEYFEMDLRKARSIVLSQKEEEHKCPYVDNPEVLTIDCITKIIYLQTESGKITTGWEKAIKAAASFNGIQLNEMQLTQDHVPVIVDKCIDFLYAHGTLAEGIYRQSGSNTRITQLLSDFQKDAWAVTLSHKDYSAHDVAGTLKRFFRTLPEPLVTSSMYKEWIRAQSMADLQSKKAEYLRLLGNLPQINYNILKKLICHLNAVHELSENNLMPLVNLAPIWGPTLMNVDSSSTAHTYDSACSECEVVRELIENYYELFRVDSQEIAREKKMQDALENFHLGSCKRKHSGDMKIWIYLWDKDESSAHNVTLTPQSTADTIVQQICTKHRIRNMDNLGILEVVCQRALERPLHPSEKVIETVLRWSIWDIDERKDNYLILKHNTLYPSLIPFAKESRPLTGELKYADSKSKSLRKYPFTFNQGTLRCSKDSKGLNELASWKVDDIVWYMGCEAKRTPPTKWSVTFVKKNAPFKRGKEEPYFGNVLSFASEEELQKWWGSMLVTLHPEGLYPSVMI